MGDLRDWMVERIGVAEEERSLSSSSSSSKEAGICVECGKMAEEATVGIITQVQPTVVSEERRKKVIDYVQRLFKSYLGCEDFVGLNFEEALANDVCSVLERGDHNRAAKFVVKDVQLIQAEVKLVKCLVQNIVVDLSLNQLRGPYALCFLEQVDRLVGKDHLFKRSIILIKAWCYYECRILGAHHGLISSYALETLVLYIFNFFHSSLDDPLAVLYKFLDYFSKFDWDNYCISLNGPIHMSTLPDFVVETPDNGGGDLLFSNDFLKEFGDMFSATSRGYESNSHTFPRKHLNILDPLRENNNLGRCVSKGNFYRIRSAFTYGARKLGCILSQTEESIAGELRKFFSNTLDRLGSGQRPDVQDPAPLSRFSGFGATLSVSSADSSQEDQTFHESESSNSSTMLVNYRSDNDGSLRKVDNDNVSLTETNFSRTSSEMQGSIDVTSVSEIHPSDDAEDLATSRSQGLIVSNDADKPLYPSANGSISSTNNVWHATHLYICCSSLDNGYIRNGNGEIKQPEISFFEEMNVTSRILLATGEVGTNIHGDNSEKQLVHSHRFQSPIGSKHHPLILNSACSSEDLYPRLSLDNPASICAAENQETLSSLLDLYGDYESHLQSLNYGRWPYDYALSASVSPISSPLVSPNSVQFKRNAISSMNANGVVTGKAYYPMNPPVLHGESFALDEMPKPRRTGTYLPNPNPNTNHYKDRSLTARSPRNNGHAITSPETSSPETRGRELAQVQSVNQGGRKSMSLELGHCKSEKVLSRSTSGSMHQPDRFVEFGSIGALPLGSASPDSSKQHNPGSPDALNSSASMPRPKSAAGTDQNRILAQSFHLKNEEDFPPLSI